MLTVAEKCPHDVEPIPNDSDWGRCRLCGATDFPMTDAAAYGPVDCTTCYDTGLVPVDVPGCFAEGPCHDCALGKRGTP